MLKPGREAEEEVNILKMRRNDDKFMTDLLVESLKNQDLTIFCLNGRFHCNQFLFSSIFPGIRQTIAIDTFFSQEDNPLSLTIPDISVKDLTEFFNNIYSKEPNLNPSSGIQYLLNLSQNISLKQSVSLPDRGGDPNEGLEENHVKKEVDYSDDEEFNKVQSEEGSFSDEGKPVKLNFTRKKTNIKKRSRKKLHSGDSDSDWNGDIKDDPYLSEDEEDQKIFKKRKGDDESGNKLTSMTRTKHHKFALKSLRCTICEVTLKCNTDMWRHVFEIHGPHPLENLTCYDCNVVLDSPGRLRSHINRGHPPLTLPCPECGLVFSTKELRVHMKTHGMIQCKECGDKFTSRLRLKKHTIAVHGGKDYSKMTNSELGKECDLQCRCNIKFESVLEKVHHFKLVHLDNFKPCPICGKPEPVNKKGNKHDCLEVEEEKKRKKAEETHICQLCGKIFNKHASLDYHNRTIHSQNPVTCQMCGKLFDHEIALKSHIFRMHRETLPCEICGAMVKDMKAHLHTVHLQNSEKRHQCPHCDKGFARSMELKRHTMNAHLKLRPYRCRYGCDMAYNDRSNMRQHEKRRHGAVWTPGSTKHQPSEEF